MVGGVPIAEGDGILALDDASGAWWRASVRETRGKQVLVHYSGCDDAWDEWIDASSPKLMRMDTVEQAKDMSAFQADTIEDAIDDEELLAQYRQRRWDDNARWQLQTFAGAQLGSFSGSVELYEADGAGGMRRAPLGTDDASCKCEGQILSNDAIELVESLPAAAAEFSLSTCPRPLGTVIRQPLDDDILCECPWCRGLHVL